MKTLGVELKSRIDMLSTMIALPSVILYIFWSTMSKIDVVSTSSSKLVPISNYTSYLSAITSNIEFFEAVKVAQFAAFHSALTRLILSTFITGTILAALFIGEPISGGQIIIDVSLVGSKVNAIIKRTTPVVYYGGFLSIINVFIVTLSKHFGIFVQSRALLAIFISSFLAFIWGVVLTIFLTLIFKNQIYPVATGFVIIFLSMYSYSLRDVLMPSISLMYLMWSREFGTFSEYLLMGIFLEGIVAVSTLEIIKRREMY
ncbi:MULTISPECIES: hypothetical protein [Pyrococcus]|nr:hypothetical protein [Pyrococcus furiosus]